MKKILAQRLESLDILRGFDLFMLVTIEPVLLALKDIVSLPLFKTIMIQFDHCKWEGFLMWDLVMPLFMFMAGVSIPFSLSKYKNDANKFSVYKRILKRVILLWILGALCQGNLLDFDLHTLRFYSNTLQAIAAGYFTASMFYLHFNLKWQLISAFLLLLSYWVIMMFVQVGNYGAGNFTPEYNICEWIDQQVLGHWRDGVVWDDSGNWHFVPWYQYTWILSSVNFGATVMSGLFAGILLRSSKIEALQKVKYLFLIGITSVCLGWLWGLQMPVIKKIWTSSMVLVSSGYCYLLMGLFYYIIDYKKWNKGIGWLKYYGMNSILAYTITCVINFSSIGVSLLHGIEQYVGVYYPAFITLSNVIIVFFILKLFYNRGIFLKV